LNYRIPFSTTKVLKTFLAVLLILAPLCSRSQLVPLLNGFAHNDYCHKHPLADALQNGYTNIEADIFWEGGELIVAHMNPFFRTSKTLEKLYLKPLAQRIAENNGHVYKNYTRPVILMIDIKTGAKNTYKALKPLLERYRPILSSYDSGKVTQRAITIVLSGHRPSQLIKSEENRLVFVDEDLRKADADTAGARVYSLASCKYSKMLSWTGKGEFPAKEREKLCRYVKFAHQYGLKVRLWASPERQVVWDELLKCGVDLINTNKLTELKDFLIARDKVKEANNQQKLVLAAGK
jgi:hypothetical protein